MVITDLRPIPPHPNLEQYKKLAKDLLRAVRESNPAAVDRVRKFQPRASRQLTLTGAQLIIAREHGFASWPSFAKHVAALQNENSPTFAFESAASAIAQGEADVLERLLRKHPNLIRECSARNHRATLLHYTGANGVEDYRQKTPPNIVTIAAALLNAGAEIDAVANIYGRSTTLSLAASSVHPEHAGVQLPLLEVLLENGAAIDGVSGTASPILAALRNGRGEAAQFLAERGATLDLESAAGTGRLDAVRAIVAAGNASGTQRASGLAWACEYGHAGVVEFLMETGSEPNETYEGQTPLHWAAIGAQHDIAHQLLERGASVHIRSRYGSTPLAQAQWSAAHDDRPARFDAIIELLAAEE